MLVAIGQGAAGEHAGVIQSTAPDHRRRDRAFSLPDAGYIASGILHGCCYLTFVGFGKTTYDLQLLECQIEGHVDEVAHAKGVENKWVCPTLGHP